MNRQEQERTSNFINFFAWNNEIQNCLVMRIAWLTALIIILVGRSLPAQELKTNLQYAEEALAEISDSLIQVFKTEGGELGVRTGSGGHGELQLLESVFLRRCAEAGIIVRIDSPRTLIHIEQVDISFRYEKTQSNMIGYDDRLHRRLKVMMKGWVEEYDNNQKKPLKIIKEKNDIVEANRINHIETDHYSFVHGKRQPGSAWQIIIEPFIVIGSVAVIIYLFFSQRT